LSFRSLSQARPFDQACSDPHAWQRDLNTLGGSAVKLAASIFTPVEMKSPVREHMTVMKLMDQVPRLAGTSAGKLESNFPDIALADRPIVAGFRRQWGDTSALFLAIFAVKSRRGTKARGCRRYG